MVKASAMQKGSPAIPSACCHCPLYPLRCALRSRHRMGFYPEWVKRCPEGTVGL